jgi:hypothetical protein
MATVVTFVDYTPAPRFDGNPWTEVDIEEASSATGTWAVLETIALSPLDSDPENPIARNFTTELGTADGLWYRLIFRDASGDESQATQPVQNAAAPGPYASTVELARILKLRTPTDAQEAAMRRVLEAAAGEINAEIDLDSDTNLESWQIALAAEVNLERAVEHWRQQEAPFGLIGLGTEFGGGAERTARDSWERHALKLAPLKDQWGLA